MAFCKSSCVIKERVSSIDSFLSIAILEAIDMIVSFSRKGILAST